MILKISRLLLLSGCLRVAESVVFKLLRESKTFSRSAAACAKDYDGLAEVYSEDLQRYLVDVARGERVWFGVTKCGGRWCLTGSKQPVTYTRWGSGEPSSRILAYEHCAELHSDRKWNSIACSHERQSVCQEYQCKPTSCNSRGNCSEMANDIACDCQHVFSGKNCEHAVPCQALAAPLQGEVNCSGVYGDSHYNASCYFWCHGGHVLHGDRETVCQESGNWTLHHVQCLPAPVIPQFLLMILTVSVGGMFLILLITIIIVRSRTRKRNQERTDRLHNILMAQKQPCVPEEGRYGNRGPGREAEADEGGIYANAWPSGGDIPEPHKDQDIYENF